MLVSAGLRRRRKRVYLLWRVGEWPEEDGKCAGGEWLEGGRGRGRRLGGLGLGGGVDVLRSFCLVSKVYVQENIKYEKMNVS
jgi:hypothetical protein